MRTAGIELGLSPGDLELIAGNPSFDLSYPKIPGRDVEGIPNANDPLMREKLRQRMLKNPEGGQDLPSFLKKADAGLPVAVG